MAVVRTYFKVEAQVAPSASTDRLHRFLRFILLYDLACYALFMSAGHLMAVDPPAAVDEFLRTLAVSDLLWNFAQGSA